MRSALLILSLTLAGSLPRSLAAQCARPDSQPEPRLRWLGSGADDSTRVLALLGCRRPSLIRTGLVPANAPSAEPRIRALAPRARTIWNSDIPASANDGSIWAGRGFNTSVWMGAASTFGRISVAIYPQVFVSQNLPFPVYPSGHRERSAFASPWYSLGLSADLPLRFGDSRIVRLDPGESTAELSLPELTAGVSSAEEWWGPGIRNALLMSNNAGGIPRAYLRPTRSVPTRFGTFDARYVVGLLQESPFFDHDTRNDIRFLNAAVVTLRTALDTGLTIGLARSVYGNVRTFPGILGHSLDVLTDWHRVSANGVETRHADQLLSIMVQWIPTAGLEVHGELGKLQPPVSLREIFVDPQRLQGYTLGLTHVGSLSERLKSVVVAEVTTLEQTPADPLMRTSQFYASNSVVQGYTSRGQVIGAGIGPGSSSQYLGGMLMRGPAHLGVAVGRIRWQEDIYYSGFSPSGGFTYKSHDVSMFSELTGRYASRFGSLGVVLTRTHRYNYLGQTADAFVFGDQFDRHYSTVSVRFQPRF